MKFQHPTETGSINSGDQSWPIVDGVVDCPGTLGQFLGLDPIPEPVESAQPAPPVVSDPLDVLNGTVPDVQAFLATQTNGDVLGALEAAEVAGKNRKGVLDAILDRLEALSAPTS